MQMTRQSSTSSDTPSVALKMFCIFLDTMRQGQAMQARVKRYG